MEELVFVVKCYDKCELAMMYFPTLRRNAAVSKLRRWMRNCRPLMDELLQYDFHPKMKTYSVREVRLIARHLGGPY